MPQRLLLKHTPETVLATPYHNVADRDTLLSFPRKESERPPYTIWITHLEQIHQFVQRIPDLAWELMDYATEPLSIIYSHGKPIAGKKAPSEICIRLIRHPKLLQQLPDLKPWLSVRLHGLQYAKAATGWVEKEINCYEPSYSERKLKIMQIYDDGSFTFLK